MTLNDLFKNTTYDDTLFSAEAKSAIESRIFMKSVRGSEVPYIDSGYYGAIHGAVLRSVQPLQVFPCFSVLRLVQIQP